VEISKEDGDWQQQNIHGITKIMTQELNPLAGQNPKVESGHRAIMQ
jgi:hypothetical protein